MAPRKGPETSPSPTGANRRVFNGGGDCCPGVADPYTLLSVLGTIGATTFLLRNAILQNINGGRRRRRRRDVGNVEEIIRLRSGQKNSPSLFIEFLVFKRHKNNLAGESGRKGEIERC